MARPKAWYPRYPADFIADTAHLTLEEVGAYNRLLDHHFCNDSIPADMKRMARILGVSPQKTRKLWQVLSHFFHQKGDVFLQRRMEKEIAKATEISDKRTKAAAIRWNANADASAYASGMTTTTTATTTIQNKRKDSAPSGASHRAKQAFFDWCKQAGCEAEAQDWATVLKKKKAAMTANAWTSRLTKLQNLAANEPPKDILQRSANSGWADLYERPTKARSGTGETPVQRRTKEYAEALAELDGYT